MDQRLAEGIRSCIDAHRQGRLTLEEFLKAMVPLLDAAAVLYPEWTREARMLWRELAAMAMPEARRQDRRDSDVLAAMDRLLDRLPRSDPDI